MYFGSFNQVIATNTTKQNVYDRPISVKNPQDELIPLPNSGPPTDFINQEGVKMDNIGNAKKAANNSAVMRTNIEIALIFPARYKDKQTAGLAEAPEVNTSKRKTPMKWYVQPSDVSPRYVPCSVRSEGCRLMGCIVLYGDSMLSSDEVK